MIEAHCVKSIMHKRLPKPHEKGANAEADVVAYIWLATQIISVLLSLKMRSAIHSEIDMYKLYFVFGG